jgi:hypothetical protein
MAYVLLAELGNEQDQMRVAGACCSVIIYVNFGLVAEGGKFGSSHV